MGGTRKNPTNELVKADECVHMTHMTMYKLFLDRPKTPERYRKLADWMVGDVVHYVDQVLLYTDLTS